MTDSVSEETEAMMKCLADWADKMVGFFPASPVREGYGYNHYKIPGSRTLLTPPVAMRQAYERCAREILRAAVNISNAKPEKAKLAKVAGIVGYPDMFSSEVCVFLTKAIG
ncbi:DUF3916 domain-containing protein [Asticcacaulis taihuensis]|uniref:DUF3916 domain-containing protein n=1 Tax=Asticcacaulis taihuensis TaxID=260084 RepID=UPI000B81D685|nr:DUF3916 domain-containing protein [Asticcacaulis taihuensis]